MNEATASQLFEAVQNSSHITTFIHSCFQKPDIVNKTQLNSHEFRLCLLEYKVLHKNEKS